MGAFLKWSAGQYDELRRRLEARAAELRSQARGAVHARIPAALAELQSGWEIWLSFACEVGAIEETERVQLERRNTRALQELAELQIHHHRPSDPALRFVALLRAALADGRAHVADRRGKPPESPEFWGWQRNRTGRELVPQGTRIGWVAEGDLFLEPISSYDVVQASGKEPMRLSEQALRRRLRQHGILASTDIGRQMLLVRRILEGGLKQVLHLKTNTIRPAAQEHFK